MVEIATKPLSPFIGNRHSFFEIIGQIQAGPVASQAQNGEGETRHLQIYAITKRKHDGAVIAVAPV